MTRTAREVTRAAREVTRAALVVVAATAAGCGASTDPNAKPLADLEAATRALDRAVGVQTAFITVGNVDVGATPDIIATSLWGRVMTEAAGCVTATHDAASVHAEFADGCMLATAMMRVSGVADVGVEPEPTGGRRMRFDLGLTIDGVFVSGELVVSTETGQSFTYSTGGLTAGTTTVSAPLVKAGIAGGGATLDASNATVAGSAFMLAAVHERFAACYPDEGAATLGTLGVTFSSVTPQTGAVTLATGKAATLPARSGCPK